MNIPQEIARQVEQLPPSEQEQVLRFVASLTTAVPAGENGAALRQFANSLDPASARQMREAIERKCEKVDPNQW